jgi:hypothetical protein
MINWDGTGPDKNVLRLGIGTKGVRKTWEILAGALTVRLSSHCTLEEHFFFALSFWTLPLALLAPPGSSPLPVTLL